MPKPAVPKSGGLRSVKEENQHTHDTKKKWEKNNNNNNKKQKKNEGPGTIEYEESRLEFGEIDVFFFFGRSRFIWFFFVEWLVNGRKGKKKKETDKSFDAANLRRRL